VGLYTTYLLKSVCETFLYMKNHVRDKHVHNKIMAKVLEDTNQGTPAQGDSCVFPFLGNVGAPLITTLNILGLNVQLLVWFLTTLNVMNYLYDSQISTLCHGHRMNIDPLSFPSMNYTSPPSPYFGESLVTSN
jgi:hypothetical protein